MTENKKDIKISCLNLNFDTLPSYNCDDTIVSCEHKLSVLWESVQYELSAMLSGYEAGGILFTGQLLFLCGGVGFST